MIESVDTPNINYKIVIIEIIPELPGIDGIDAIYDKNIPGMRPKKDG